jgi:TetR/AcrR family transcriptional regulator, regulator of cefoperazone and chloramphenicol sensitivity
VRSALREEDVTARTRIRIRALELFAQDGPEAVTVRAIARAAGVSPALVLHHFGSKQGLRAAVDAHVQQVLDDALDGLTDDPGLLADGQAARSIGEVLLELVPSGSPIPGYLRWSLLGGDSAGRRLFRDFFEHSSLVTERLTAAGLMQPSADPAVRSAFLLANDLVLLLLRDRLADVLGVDPLSAAGSRRWIAEVLAAYTHGVFTSEVS